MPYTAKYSSKRDKLSSKSDKEAEEHIKKALKTSYNIKWNRGNRKDFEGIDIEIDDKKIQKKTLKYLGFNTVTITEKEYNKYRNKGIDYLFHCYYDSQDPSTIIKCMMIKMDDFLNLDLTRRTNHKTKTDFVFKYYHQIPKDIIIYRYNC